MVVGKKRKAHDHFAVYKKWVTRIHFKVAGIVHKTARVGVVLEGMGSDIMQFILVFGKWRLCIYILTNQSVGGRHTYTYYTHAYMQADTAMYNPEHDKYYK